MPAGCEGLVRCTFGHDHHGRHDDDGDSGGDRRVRISSRPGGLAAWADLRVSVPAGRTLAVHLVAVSAPVAVNGAKGELGILSAELVMDTASGDIDR